MWVRDGNAKALVHACVELLDADSRAIRLRVGNDISDRTHGILELFTPDRGAAGVQIGGQLGAQRGE